MLDIIESDSDASRSLFVGTSDVMLANLDRGLSALKNVLGLSVPVYTVGAAGFARSFQNLWLNVTGRHVCGDPAFTGGEEQVICSRRLSEEELDAKARLSPETIQAWRDIEEQASLARGV